MYCGDDIRHWFVGSMKTVDVFTGFSGFHFSRDFSGITIHSSRMDHDGSVKKLTGKTAHAI